MGSKCTQLPDSIKMIHKTANWHTSSITQSIALTPLSLSLPLSSSLHPSTFLPSSSPKTQISTLLNKLELTVFVNQGVSSVDKEARSRSRSSYLLCFPFFATCRRENLESNGKGPLSDELNHHVASSPWSCGVGASVVGEHWHICMWMFSCENNIYKI